MYLMQCSGIGIQQKNCNVNRLFEIDKYIFLTIFFINKTIKFEKTLTTYQELFDMLF